MCYKNQPIRSYTCHFANQPYEIGSPKLLKYSSFVDYRENTFDRTENTLCLQQTHLPSQVQPFTKVLYYDFVVIHPMNFCSMKPY